MSLWKKALLLQLAFFIGLPILAALLIGVLKFYGFLAFILIFALWCWQLYAYTHYRHCRQEEFLYVLKTATDAQAPLESLLGAYLADRPREHLYRGGLLLFVFPGYYWIHLQRSFDARLARLTGLLEGGLPLQQALRAVPGLVSNDVAMAVTVGEFTGNVPQALHRLPDRRAGAIWIELFTRLLYPAILLLMLLNVFSFLMVFVIPKFRRIFADFQIELPEITEGLIFASNILVEHGWILPFLVIDGIILANFLVFSSTLRWYFPILGRLYRMQKRGEVLRTIGMMLETGRPLPAILDAVLDAGLLPAVVQKRVSGLAEDLHQGEALADALERRGLLPSAMKGLVVSAQKANNLAWALQEIGDTLVRRSMRLTQRLTAIVFPLVIFVCAILIGFVAVAIFTPLIHLIEGVHG